MTDRTRLDVRIVEADLDRGEHQRAILLLTDAYARDPMGNRAPLPEDVGGRLIEGLRRHPTTIVLLAYAGAEAVGLANCFLGFSTFFARPLLNLHDLVVVSERRGQGVGRLLLAAVEEKARALGCCKLTLEVSERNDVARTVYERAGFSRPTYGEAGALLVYAKTL